MQLLVQNCLDPSRATEIFSVLKRRILTLPKIVRNTEIKVDCSEQTKLTRIGIYKMFNIVTDSTG